MEVSEKEMKYKAEIDAIEATGTTCGGSTYVENDLDAYRWTFEQITHSDNFIPRAKILKTEKLKNDCLGWALSFFDTEPHAVDELNRICTDKKNLYKKLGTHISEGKINTTDGVNGNFNNTSGHFSHYEYKGTDFSKKFTVKTEVYK